MAARVNWSKRKKIDPSPPASSSFCSRSNLRAVTPTYLRAVRMRKNSLYGNACYVFRASQPVPSENYGLGDKVTDSCIEKVLSIYVVLILSLFKHDNYFLPHENCFLKTWKVIDATREGNALSRSSPVKTVIKSINFISKPSHIYSSNFILGLWFYDHLVTRSNLTLTGPRSITETVFRTLSL